MKPTTVEVERRFGSADMFVPPEGGPWVGRTGKNSERAVLLDYLRDYRLTLQLKCTDLSPEQLARRSVPPSTLSLLGLVRHMAGVEQVWFRIRMAGQSVASALPPRGPAQARLRRRGGRSGGGGGGLGDLAVGGGSSPSSSWPGSTISVSSARRATSSATSWCT